MRDGWKEVPLGEIVELGKGGSWGQDDPSVDLIQAVCLRGTDLAELIDRRIPEAPVRWIKESELRKSACSKGMVLIETSGSKCGRSIVLTEEILAKFELPLIYSNFCRTLKIDTRVVAQEFVEIWFSYNYANGLIPSYRATSAMPNLDVKALLRVERIKVPPLPEQKRIVDLISSVDSYIEALQQQLENAKRSRNAVLHELLTAGGEGWVETTLGEVARLNPEQARDFGSDRLIKYIDLSTVTFDTGINSEIDQIPFNEAPGRARRIIRENDVIVSTVRPYLKGFAFVGKEFEGQIASTGFCVIRAKSELILSELIWALVGSDDFVEFLIKRSTGSNYPAVRPNDVSDFTFMLPPLNDQVTVSQLIRIFDDLIKDSSILVSSAQNLRSGLLSNLLSGEHEIPSGYDKVMGAA